MNEVHSKEVYEYRPPTYATCDMRTAAFANEVIRLLGESDPSSVDIVSAQAEVAAFNPSYEEASQAEAVAVVTRYFEALRRRRIEETVARIAEKDILPPAEATTDIETIV